MIKVAVSDFTFSNLAIERQVLASCDVEFIEAQCHTEEELIAQMSEVDYIITQYAPISARVIPSLARCKVISRYGVGVDNIDLEAASQAGIPVCNVPDYCVNEVADHALALMLGATRYIVQGAACVRSGRWEFPAANSNNVQVLSEMVVGLLGCGRIGRGVATRLRGFGCRLLACDPYVSDEDIISAGAIPVSFEELLAESDVVSLHTPSNAETRGIISAEVLAQMKDGVILVNVSRGDLVVTNDLIQAIESGKVQAAAVDVTDPEPLPAGHPLAALDNVIITAHFAAVSQKAMLELRQRTAGAIAAAIRGEVLQNVVNGVDGPRQL